MGLSPKLVGNLFDVVLQPREEGLSLFLVERNAKPTFDATSHCLVMESGEVAMSGTSAELSHDPRVREAYLGL
ncbi:hypothetical protein AB0L50_37525 [Streptomyces flaveolus]|uniref:ABC transporter ATP-binding protein C-terminal domain-containing protein n=1 Tax=Streptomyces flaveolus TaxID=67297 RepID=UPI0034149C85